MESANTSSHNSRRLNLSAAERQRRSERIRNLNLQGKTGWRVSEKKLKFLISKFLRLVDIRSEDECWLAFKTQKSGYSATLRDGKRILTGARAAIELATGKPVPKGRHVDHFLDCDRACCNPAHLKVTTPSQNIKRAWARRKAREASA